MKRILKKSDKTVEKTTMRSKNETDSMFAALIVELLNSVTTTHLKHLSVTGPSSYAIHKALNEYYDAIPDLVDTVVESYQGACEVLLNFETVQPDTLKNTEALLSHLRNLSKSISEIQKVIPHSEIVSGLDMIKDEINKLKYKLLFLL